MVRNRRDAYGNTDVIAQLNQCAILVAGKILILTYKVEEARLRSFR